MAKDSCDREIVNLCFTRGDNPILVLTLTDELAAAIDLTGAAVLLTVDSLEEPPDTATQIFVLTGAIQSPTTAGIVHFSPTTAQANQAPAAYFYDVQVTFSDGSRRTVVAGDWEYDARDISEPGEV